MNLAASETSPLPEQRQARILAEVNAHGAARVSDLVALLGVSDMTIRRDIAQLAELGKLARVHGGAVSTSPRSEEPGFAVKAQLNTGAKQLIGAHAATLVAPGDTIAISAGTTTVEFALALRERALDRVTIVTNSIPVAQIFHTSSAALGDASSVILTGGERTPSDALVGPIANAALASLNVDRLFLGVHGIDARAGLTTPNIREATTDAALIGAAVSTVVLADSTKWGMVGLKAFAPLSAISLLITDSALPDDAAAQLREHDVDVRAL